MEKTIDKTETKEAKLTYVTAKLSDEYKLKFPFNHSYKTKRYIWQYEPRSYFCTNEEKIAITKNRFLTIIKRKVKL